MPVVCSSVIVSCTATGPWKIWGLLLVADPAGFPNASISERPIPPCPWVSPAAVSTVNCTQVTVLDANDIRLPFPPIGNAPTATVLPSLKLSVPERTLSVVLGRSYSTTFDSVTALGQVSRIQAPAACPRVTHSALL